MLNWLRFVYQRYSAFSNPDQIYGVYLSSNQTIYAQDVSIFLNMSYLNLDLATADFEV